MRGPHASWLAALVVMGRSGVNEVGASGTCEGDQLGAEDLSMFGGDMLGLLHYVPMYDLLISDLGLVDVEVCSPVRCYPVGGLVRQLPGSVMGHYITYL